MCCCCCVQQAPTAPDPKGCARTHWINATRKQSTVLLQVTIVVYPVDINLAVGFVADGELNGLCCICPAGTHAAVVAPAQLRHWLSAELSGASTQQDG